MESPDAFRLEKSQSPGHELRLAMLLKVKTSQGHTQSLRTLIDTGAEANLIRQGVLDSHFFRAADDPIQLVTANGQTMMGGTRTVALEIAFNPCENGTFLDKPMKFEAICYEADISVDLILSLLRMKKHKIGVFPNQKALSVDETRFMLLYGQPEKRGQPPTLPDDESIKSHTSQ